MAEKEIKSKIVLDGEKEYSNTIRNANRNLKTLKSELQAETKELGKNATAQQKAATKAESLRAQIVEQEKVVQACKAALEEVKEKYGDNEDAIARYEVKLNNARAALADMNNELSQANIEANTDTSAMESLANAMENISNVAESVSSSIEGIFTGIISAVRDTTVELWSMIAETSAKANNWTDLASLWGTDAQTIQQWSGSMHAAGKDLSDLQTLVSRIVLGGKEKQITEMLGISDVNYTDKWEYATQVISELYRKVQAGEDITPISEAIFGEKKSTTVMDLVNAWGDILGELETYNGDTGGFGLSSEGLETFNQISLQISEIEAKWEGLKDRFLEGFGVTTLTLQAHVIGGLDALADFMNAETDEEREAALEKLQEEVEGFARDAAAAIEAGIEALGEIGASLKDSDNPYVAAVGNIFDGIANTLQWIIDNQDAVVNALKAIFGFWLVTKIASIAGKLSSIVASIGVIKAWSAMQGAAGAASSAATAAAAPAARAGLGTVLASTGAKVLGATALGAYLTLKPADTAENDLDELINEDTGLLTTAGKEAKNGVNIQGFSLHGENYQNPLNGITPEQQEAAETFWDFWKNWDREDDDAFDDAYEAYEKAFEGNEGLFDSLDEMMDRLYQTNENPSSIEDLPASFWENLTSSETLKKSDVAAFNKVPEDMATAVENALTSGLSGVRVEMDGQTVGNLVLPYINQGLAIAMR